MLTFFGRTIINGVEAQYGSGYGVGQKSAYNTNYGAVYGGGYGGDEQAGEEVDERPKVQLGLRLRIPAFRFELPRVNLPKITISAKIRQPDRPRTINLPEINLDTSSKVSAPGLGTMSGQTQVTSDNGGGYGGYSAASAYNKPVYQVPKNYGGGAPETVNHFSFSAGEESSAKRYPTRDQNYQHKQAATEYSSSQVQQSYALADQNGNLNLNNQYQSRDPDLGFNTPVNVDPNKQYMNTYNSNRAIPYRGMARSIVSREGSSYMESRMQNSRASQESRHSRYLS